MSVQGAKTFQDRILTDQEFQRRATEATRDKEGPAATEALIELGRHEGIELTRQDLIGVQRALSDRDQIAEEDLGAVAGGGSWYQNARDKQNQAASKLSNVSKTMYNSAHLMISNIG